MSFTTRLEEHKLLAPFTTFAIGGPARWFFQANSEDDVVEATAWAHHREIPLFVLGGGSNLLVADAGFNGLVLRVDLHGTSVDPGLSTSHKIYRAAAGEDWDSLVQRTVDQNCAGVECLAGIPGTVGGTPVQNVGAYGQEVSSVIDRVRAFALEDRVFVELTAAECAFAYRSSRFNSTDRGRFLVTRVDYRLQVDGPPSLRYPDLQRAIAEHLSPGAQPTLRQVAALVRNIRQSKGMLLVEGDPDCRSAGSFFKNPIVAKSRLTQIAAAAAKEPPHYPVGLAPELAATVKIPAAWLIEQSGLPKGHALGDAAISSRHTLALVNRGKATAAEILALAAQITAAVHDKFGISLELEPVLLGF